jgi:CRP-like cAMP-binding protein
VPSTRWPTWPTSARPNVSGCTSTGRYDVFIDTRLIRSHGPGDHFGELAARDWGGGYGYARLATVRCAEPGRLLKLTTEDLAWLTDSQPAVKARIAATLAERLQNR